jgi:hypothetical protein
MTRTSFPSLGWRLAQELAQEQARRRVRAVHRHQISAPLISYLAARSTSPAMSRGVAVRAGRCGRSAQHSRALEGSPCRN